MLLPTTVAPFRRLALLVALLASCAVLAGSVGSASAQGLLQQPPVTKQQLEEAEREAAERKSSDDGGSITLWLIVIGVIGIAGATAYILRDARDAAGGNERSGPKPLASSGVRGAPKSMFTGDAAPGGKTGKRTKRQQGKRQRQARKAARRR